MIGKKGTVGKVIAQVVGGGVADAGRQALSSAVGGPGGDAATKVRPLAPYSGQVYGPQLGHRASDLYGTGSRYSSDSELERQHYAAQRARIYPDASMLQKTNEQSLAFDYGIDLFCKHADFDDEDIAAMRTLLKQAGIVGTAARKILPYAGAALGGGALMLGGMAGGMYGLNRAAPYIPEWYKEYLDPNAVPGEVENLRSRRRLTGLERAQAVQREKENLASREKELNAPAGAKPPNMNPDQLRELSMNNTSQAVERRLAAGQHWDRAITSAPADTGVDTAAYFDWMKQKNMPLLTYGNVKHRAPTMSEFAAMRQQPAQPLTPYAGKAAPALASANPVPEQPSGTLSRLP